MKPVCKRCQHSTKFVVYPFRHATSYHCDLLRTYFPVTGNMGFVKGVSECENKNSIDDPCQDFDPIPPVDRYDRWAIAVVVLVVLAAAAAAAWIIWRVT